MHRERALELLRNLEQIGVAATHSPEEVSAAHSENPLAGVIIIVTRNRLIHGFLGIDDDPLWSIIQDECVRTAAAAQGAEKRSAFMKTMPPRPPKEAGRKTGNKNPSILTTT